MSEILLDTCVVIDFLRNQGKAAAYIQSLLRPPSVSVLTISEIGAGLRSQKEELAARRFFRHCELLPVTADIAENAGAHLRHYRSSHAIGIADAIIAATAESRGLQIATLNVKHFPMFKRLRPVY